MDWFESVAEALSAGRRLVDGVSSVNRALDHIERLLVDASVLFQAGSYSTSVFLAITALEETAKAHVGMFRAAGRSEAPRFKDPLFHHGKKHRLAAAPTVAMGARLPAAIGEDRVRDLVADAQTGALVRLRESALYFSSDKGQVVAPVDLISRERARELILFAIEVFDDGMVGYTDHSYEIGNHLDHIFTMIADSR
jgi:AbiV family abortive infection protein